MFLLPAKAMVIWLAILFSAIVNAAVREMLLVPLIGSGAALPVSGLLLTAFIFVVTYLSIPFIGATEGKAYVTIGILWFGLTLSFEFAMGYFIAGKSFGQVIEVFNVTKGNLFVVALLATLAAPWLTARLRGLI